MKLYRLYNLTELGPASSLSFLKREGAEAYKDLVKWPYADSGRWPLAMGGSVALDQVDLRVEALDMDVVIEPTLDVALWEQHGVLGGASMLPGDCFNPDEWHAYGSADFAHPVTGPRLEQAWEQLKRGTQRYRQPAPQKPKRAGSARTGLFVFSADPDDQSTSITAKRAAPIVSTMSPIQLPRLTSSC